MQFKGIKLFEKRVGKEKTNHIAFKHFSTIILFLIIVLFVAFGDKDPISSITILMLLLLLEVIFGFYMNISFRLRKLEEINECKKR